MFYKNTASEALSTRVSGSSGDQINNYKLRKRKKVCAASRHNLSKSVGVEETSGSPWEHAEVAKRRSIKGKAPSKRGTGRSAGQKEREKK